eukprot:SAG31_NODE_1791_length_7258_cov_12.040928_6_plen_101_part_00
MTHVRWQIPPWGGFEAEHADQLAAIVHAAVQHFEKVYVRQRSPKRSRNTPMRDAKRYGRNGSLRTRMEIIKHTSVEVALDRYSSVEPTSASSSHASLEQL